jgi:hypothetical protein
VNGLEQSRDAGGDFLLHNGDGFGNIEILLPHMTDHFHLLHFEAGWMSLLCFTPTDPIVRFPVLVGYRDDKNMVFFYRIHQLIWKLVQETLPDFTPLYGPRFRIFGDS